MHFKFAVVSCLTGSVAGSRGRNISVFQDEEFFETRLMEYRFSSDPTTARSEVARLVIAVAAGDDHAKNNLWRRINGNAFVAKAVETGGDDLIKAAVSLVGDLTVLGVEMPEFDPNPLCDRIQPKLYLRTFEFEFARQAMRLTGATRKLKVWRFTPFANFDAVKCAQPFSLEFRAKMMREQIVRNWFGYGFHLTFRPPFITPKISSKADFDTLSALIYAVEAYDCVTIFDVMYEDKAARGVSVIRDMLGRFFQMVNKVGMPGDDASTHPIYSIVQHEPVIYLELRAVGKALGLSVLYNFPVGFLIDPALLDYLMTEQPVRFVEDWMVDASNASREWWLLKKGFKDIVPQIGFEMGRYMSVAEFGSIMLGRPDTALTIQVLRKCVVGVDQAIVEEEVGARFVRYAPETAYTRSQETVLENLFAYLESHHREADFVLLVTGQHVVPVGALRSCPSMQIVFVPLDEEGEEILPSAKITYNRFFLPEYSSREALERQMDKFFETM